MSRQRRPRHYLGPGRLLMLKPVLRYSATRDAYVLRLVGRSLGPVLRVNRRARRQHLYGGLERRRTSAV